MWAQHKGTSHIRSMQSSLRQPSAASKAPLCPGEPSSQVGDDSQGSVCVCKVNAHQALPRDGRTNHTNLHKSIQTIRFSHCDLHGVFQSRGLMSEPEVSGRLPPPQPMLTHMGTKPQVPQPHSQGPSPTTPRLRRAEGCWVRRSRAQRKKTLGGTQIAFDFKCSCFHFYP